jgi:hypothetical protein
MRLGPRPHYRPALHRDFCGCRRLPALLPFNDHARNGSPSGGTLSFTESIRASSVWIGGHPDTIRIKVIYVRMAREELSNDSYLHRAARWSMHFDPDFVASGHCTGILTGAPAIQAALI